MPSASPQPSRYAREYSSNNNFTTTANARRPPPLSLANPPAAEAPFPMRRVNARSPLALHAFASKDLDIDDDEMPAPVPVLAVAANGAHARFRSEPIKASPCSSVSSTSSCSTAGARPRFRSVSEEGPDAFRKVAVAIPPRPSSALSRQLCSSPTTDPLLKRRMQRYLSNPDLSSPHPIRMDLDAYERSVATREPSRERRDSGTSVTSVRTPSPVERPRSCYDGSVLTPEVRFGKPLQA